MPDLTFFPSHSSLADSRISLSIASVLFRPSPSVPASLSFMSDLGDQLGDGDFTKTKLWPRVQYGIPDKADVLDAQNQVLAAFMIKEAAKRREFEASTTTLLNSIAQALKIKPKLSTSSTIISSRQSGSRATSPPTATAAAISAELAAKVLEFTKLYKQSSPDGLTKVRQSKNMNQKVEKWKGFMESMLEEDHLKIFQGLTASQVEATFVENSMLVNGPVTHVKARSKKRKSDELEVGEDNEDAIEESDTHSNICGPASNTPGPQMMVAEIEKENLLEPLDAQAQDSSSKPRAGSQEELLAPGVLGPSRRGGHHSANSGRISGQGESFKARKPTPGPRTGIIQDNSSSIPKPYGLRGGRGMHDEGSG